MGRGFDFAVEPSYGLDKYLRTTKLAPPLAFSAATLVVVVLFLALPSTLLGRIVLALTVFYVYSFAALFSFVYRFYKREYLRRVSEFLREFGGDVLVWGFSNSTFLAKTERFNLAVRGLRAAAYSIEVLQSVKKTGRALRKNAVQPLRCSKRIEHVEVGGRKYAVEVLEGTLLAVNPERPQEALIGQGWCLVYRYMGISDYARIKVIAEVVLGRKAAEAG